MKLQQQLDQTQDLPLAVSSNLIVQEFENEILIYNLKTNKAFCLNATSAAVWQACDGNRSVANIAHEASKKLHTHVNEEIVWLALEQLKKDELLADSEDFVIDYGGLSRREVIKKVGLATLVAFPLVSSLIAPVPAQAGSGSSSGACTNNCILGACVCTSPISCSPGRTVSIGVTAGVCISASAAASTLGISVGAGLNGNVCVVAAVCLL